MASHAMSSLLVLVLAFSTVGAVEGAVAVNTGILNELSVQQLVDCVGQDNSCSGGDFDDSFSYVEDHGLSSSSNYRFIQQASPSCSADKYAMVSKISNYHLIPSCSTESMKAVVATRPIAAAIDGRCFAFRNYGGGHLFGQLW